MTTLKEFQEHYGIEDVEKAKVEYQRYLEALDLFRRIDERREARRPEIEGMEDLDDED